MPADPPPGVNLIGCLTSEKGLGEAARGLVRAARAVGIPLATNDFILPGSENRVREVAVDWAGLPHPVNLLAVNVDSLLYLNRNIDLRRARRGRYTVGYWFWEQREFPATWFDRFPLVDEVWVGSTFTQQAVAAVSPVPVLVVPPALVPDPLFTAIPKPALELPADCFLFLFVFDAASELARKNPVGLVRAFAHAFPSNPAVRLVLKVSRLETCPADERAELLAAVAADRRVQLLGGVVPRPTLTGLLAAADCYVSLHRAEGFGLTPAEAMLLGKPVIATGYSGTTDFMTPWNSLPVDYRLVTLDRDRGPYRAGLMWADPDLADAADKMRWVVANRAAAARLGARGRAETLARHRPEAVGAVMAERLRQIVRHRTVVPPEPAVGWELLTDPVDEIITPVGGPAAVGVSVRDPFPAPAEPGVTLVGEWHTFTGDPLPDGPPFAVLWHPVPPDPYLPIIHHAVPFAPPAGPGDYQLALGLRAADGRRLAGPLTVQVRVTGAGPDIDYRREYAAADFARDHWTVTGPATAAEYDRLGRVKRDMLLAHGLTPTSRLLDVGCGTGQVAVAVEELLTTGTYHGTDLAAEAVRFCQTRFRRPHFSFSVNEPARIGVPGPFDAVCFFSVFTHTHLSETAALLAETAGLLAPGGFLLADVFLTPMAREQAGHRGAMELNPDRFAAAVASAGLNAEVIERQPWGRYAERVFFRMVRA